MTDRERLIEVLLKVDYVLDTDGRKAKDNAEFIADYLFEHGVIVPPCKVGDTVYKVSYVHRTVIPLKVEGFIRNLSSWKVHCTHLVPSWVGNQKEHIYISFSSFGKTAFLTSKTAEKALLLQQLHNQTLE